MSIICRKMRHDRIEPLQWSHMTDVASQIIGTWADLFLELVEPDNKEGLKIKLLTLYEGNPSVICGFMGQRASNAGDVSMLLCIHISKQRWRCVNIVEHLRPFTNRSGTSQWRHNERDGVSHHQPRECLLNHLFKRRSKKTSKLCVTGLCAENSPVTGEFPAQRTSNTKNASIWSRHHATSCQSDLAQACTNRVGIFWNLMYFLP